MKKLSLLLALCLMLSFSASAYNFPQPDWGKLLKERENMVTETEFELYTKGPIESAPYYGARFEPRGGTYLGMVAENSTNFQPLGSYLTYLQNMEYSDFYYPANTMIRNDSVVAMVGWTIDSFGLVNYDHIRATLNNLNSYGKPMFIRFANEMNCSALGDDPELYKEIFRNVADMVHEYDNFAVVWSPVDLGSLDRPFELYYPGDEYVDWVGLSCYSIKYFQGNPNTEYKSSVYFMTGDFAWATNRIKPFMEFLEKNGIEKPVMISEGGVATNNKFGEDLEWWATPRLGNMLYNLVMKYPQIKMINYFNNPRPGETERFDISNYQYAADIFNQARVSGAYITNANGNAEFVFQPATNGETLIAENGIVQLYTLAHFPNTAEFAVNYTVDGEWYHATSARPFVCDLDISNMDDGAHTVEIQTLGVSKNYTFYKNGNYIRFGAEPEVPETPDYVTVKVNNRTLEFDQPPIIENGRTLVPLRAIFEALGASVSWDDNTQTVGVYRGYNNSISLTIGKSEMYVNGEVRYLDVPAKLVGGRTLVPARAVAEAFGCDVKWISETQTVVITE